MGIRITTKNEEQFKLMRRAGQIVAEALQLMREAAVAGATTRQLDELAYQHIRKSGAIPSFKGYGGQGTDQPKYPATICASVNDEVVHGIPNDVPLKPGDLLSLDCGAIYRGYHGDAAISLAIGSVSEVAQHLLVAGEESLRRGIAAAKVGAHIGAISNAIQTYAEAEGFRLVFDYGGHGIGTAMHEDPHVPNYGRPHDGMLIREGMALAIEPMLSAGSPSMTLDRDGWTLRTSDGAWASHFEHTLGFTANGPVIFTVL